MKLWKQLSNTSTPTNLYTYFGYKQKPIGPLAYKLDRVKEFQQSTNLNREEVHQLIYDNLSVAERGSDRNDYFYINVVSSFNVAPI